MTTNVSKRQLKHFIFLLQAFFPKSLPTVKELTSPATDRNHTEYFSAFLTGESPAVIHTRWRVKRGRGAELCMVKWAFQISQTR